MASHPKASGELACSLTEAQLRERRALMRGSLLPHVTECNLQGLQLAMAFASKDTVRSQIEEFVELERQCCGFLTFTISPPGETLTLNIQGPEGSRPVLDAFADAAARAT